MGKQVYLGNKPNAREVSLGLVTLEADAEGLVKRALLCRTGQFEGMYGPVTVTKELLEKIASFYNRQRAKPLNKFDFAPILKNHIRDVDLIQGRILAGLGVESWVNPENNAEEFGLYGDLRLDDPEAPEKVKQGKYAQLSITFDEETGELYEVSFVAVEAARRSQLLAQGDPQMDVKQLQQNLDKITAESKKVLAHRAALQSFIGAGRTTRLELVKSAQTELAAGDAILAAAPGAISKASLALTALAIRSQLRLFAFQGRIPKAEFDKIEFAKLAAMPKEARLALVESYGKRAVDPTLAQYGQADAVQPDLTKASPEQFRKLMELQRSGKGFSSLSEESDEDKKKREDAEKAAAAAGGEAGDNKAKGDEYALKMEDIDECMRALEEIGPMLEKISGHSKAMGGMLKKLMENDQEKEPGEEEQK